MGLCRQSQILYRMQLELLLHPVCIVKNNNLILNKYQNSRKQIWKCDGTSKFYVLVYYSVLDFHERNYWKIHKLDWTLADFFKNALRTKMKKLIQSN